MEFGTKKVAGAAGMALTERGNAIKMMSRRLFGGGANTT
jgi:hypothetical protein